MTENQNPKRGEYASLRFGFLYFRFELFSDFDIRDSNFPSPAAQEQLHMLIPQVLGQLRQQGADAFRWVRADGFRQTGDVLRGEKPGEVDRESLFGRAEGVIENYLRFQPANVAALIDRKPRREHLPRPHVIRLRVIAGLIGGCF
jgi:hypothetical protein